MNKKIKFDEFFSDDYFFNAICKVFNVEADGAIADFDYAKHYFFNDEIDFQIEYIEEKLYVMLNDDENCKIEIENNHSTFFQNVKDAIKKLKGELK